jgi:hypothetical protein
MVTNFLTSVGMQLRMPQGSESLSEDVAEKVGTVRPASQQEAPQSGVSIASLTRACFCTLSQPLGGHL